MSTETIPPTALNADEQAACFSIAHALARTRIQSVGVNAIPRPIATIPVSWTLRHAFQTLVDERILSAPVISSSGFYLGMFDMYSISNFVCGIIPPGVHPDQDSPLYRRLVLELKSAKVADWMRCPDAIYETFSLWTALESMARQNLPRIAVVNDRGQVTGILTQSMLIEWLYDNKQLLGALAEWPIDRFTGSHALATISQGKWAINAFRAMQGRKVTGLAVVDSKGQLTDNISVRDLRCLGPYSAELWRLWTPITTFKTLAKQRFPDTPSMAIAVSPSDSLQKVMQLMITNQVHRVFVVSSDRIPVNIVTQHCILSLLRFTLHYTSR